MVLTQAGTVNFLIVTLLFVTTSVQSATFTCSNHACNSDDIKISSSSEITIRVHDFDNEIHFVNSHIAGLLRVVVSLPENIETFIMSRCGIEEIYPMAFKQLHSLLTLNLAENNLTTLDEKTFSGLGQLRWIFLSHNEIREVHPNTFLPMPEIEYLNMSTNQIESLDKRIFANLKKLEAVYLDHNRLTTLSRTIFERCRSLKFVDLSHNLLKTVHFTFHDALFMLNLAHNMIDSFDVEFKTAQRIDGDVSILRLEDNRLMNITNVTGLRITFELSLASNPILYHFGNPTTNVFNNLKQLWSLNLSDTSFHFAHTFSQDHIENPFGEMAELKELDLSYNELQNVDFRQLRVNELRSLHLSGNNLTEMDLTTMKRLLPNLSAIEISNNPWNCSYLERLLQNIAASNRLEVLVQPHYYYNGPNINGIKCYNSTLGNNNVYIVEHDTDHDVRLRILEHKIEELFQKLNEAIELQQNFSKMVRNFTTPGSEN